MTNPNTVKFHFPEIYRIRFVDFCELNKLKYGRVLWTLGKMLVKGQINQGLFLNEYKRSASEVYKSHTDVMMKYRIAGDEAHGLNKLTKTVDSDKLNEVEVAHLNEN